MESFKLRYVKYVKSYSKEISFGERERKALKVIEVDN